jgi:hypothetical protein
MSCPKEEKENKMAIKKQYQSFEFTTVSFFRKLKLFKKNGICLLKYNFYCALSIRSIRLNFK